MSDYTPTTEDVRHGFAVSLGMWFNGELALRFDRWLAAHDKEVLKAAVERVEAAWDAPMSRDAYDYADWRSISTAAIRGEEQ